MCSLISEDQVATWEFFVNHVFFFVSKMNVRSHDKFSKVVVDFSSIRGPKIFGWMLIFNVF